MRFLFLALVACGAAWLSAPAAIDRAFNPVRWAGTVSARAAELTPTLEVADLHADGLLWGRDLLRRNDRGHEDLPRLMEAGVTLQVFSIVSRVPWPIRGSNGPSPDSIRWLALADAWPRRTWGSPFERALYLASRMRAAADRSEGRLVLIRSRKDLERLRAAPRERRPVGALLSVEGAQALEGDLSKLDALYDAGVRMMSPSHFYDTEVGGSAHGLGKGGLTPLGRRWLRAMERRRMIVDLAHASPATVADVLALARRPVVVSHTGVRGTCDNARNLSDEELRGVARDGGLVGIGYWSVAVCGDDPAAIARAVRHAVDVAGVRHVALGSDFDGAVAVPFDVTGLDRLATALLDAGLSEEDVSRVMGRNTLDFLSRQLP